MTIKQAKDWRLFVKKGLSSIASVPEIFLFANIVCITKYSTHVKMDVILHRINRHPRIFSSILSFKSVIKYDDEPIRDYTEDFIYNYKQNLITTYNRPTQRGKIYIRHYTAHYCIIISIK